MTEDKAGGGMTEDKAGGWLKKSIKLGTVLGFLLGCFLTWGFTKVLDAGWNKATKPEERDPYIAVIMSTNGKAFTIPAEFLKGFGSSPAITVGGRTIRIEREDDLLSPDQAERVARKLANDPECILAIGNSNSELTKITLEEFLKADPPLPYILPIATATELLEIAKQQEHHSVLRMVPDNDNQAQVIRRFAAEKKVIILVDEENRAYSEGLSRSVADGMLSNNGSILAMRSYGNSNRLADILATLPQDQSADLIIFVGVSNNGLILVEELKNLKLTTDVLFTDGCSVEQLISRASGLPGRRFVLSAVTLDEELLKPTYEPIGKDAYNLLERLLQSVAGDTRREVYGWLSKNKDTFQYSDGNAGDYAFDGDGNNKSMDFLLYEIRDKGELRVIPKY